MEKIRPLAIYLPQFHPIPENDRAWGEGFTEWTNVKKAKSLFDGHYQPHIPHESIGYYDLRDPEVLVRQAALAKKYGISGFAYYHYWFNGKRLLETPIDNMLKTGKPDFPFCFIWANENWTKRWDGSDDQIIIKQEYSPDDDREHIRYLCKNVFSDKRYITIDGKPVFIVYRTELFPDIKRTAHIWREEAINNGFKDIYLIRVENFVAGIDPFDIGFDAAMEFAPNGADSILKEKLNLAGNIVNIKDYKSTILKIIAKEIPYKCYRTVFATWDNTPRRKSGGTAFIDSDNMAFKFYLKETIYNTIQKSLNEENLLFINAWNEWGEGCHIEPDELNGFTYLEICRDLFKSFSKPNSEDESYVLFLEKTIEELSKDNMNLLQLNKCFSTMDYNLGRAILTPVRRIKNLFRITH